MYAWNFFCFLCEMRRIFTILQKWFLTTLLFSIQFWYPNCLKEPNPSSEIWIRPMNLLTYESKAENTKFWWHPKTISSWLWFKIRLSLWRANRKKRLSKRPMQYIPLSMPSLPSVYWYKSLGKSRFWKKYTLNSCLTFSDFFPF